MGIHGGKMGICAYLKIQLRNVIFYLIQTRFRNFGAITMLQEVFDFFKKLCYANIFTTFSGATTNPPTNISNYLVWLEV